MIGGLITPIAEHVGFPFNEDIELPHVGRSRCDMESLIMRMLYRGGGSYGLIVHEKRMFYLPSKNKSKVDMERN